MTDYEKDLQAAYDDGLDVKEKCLRSDAAALIRGKRIALNRRRLSTTKEKICTLAEERGHYYTSVGDIIDLSVDENRKQELKARLWAYNTKIGLRGLVAAFEHGCQSQEEIADYLNVTEKFLVDAIECYREKYGIYAIVDNYMIRFIPYFYVGKLFSQIQ